MQQKKNCISDENKICSSKYSVFGHTPKAKFGKFSLLETAASAGSKELQKISKVFLIAFCSCILPENYICL
jgi:hypothetical protein